MNSPKEIAQNYIALGASKTKYPAMKLLVLGIMAGMFVGLAGVGATFVSATVAGTSLASIGKFLSGVVFTAGLSMILIAGAELFTGNCLIVVSVLAKEAKLGDMLKNWIFVYIGNFIGGILVSVITVYGGTYSAFGGTAGVAAISTAVAKVSVSFSDILLRGIFCNFLVCVAVWMALAAKDVTGKIVALFLPIMLFVLSGYEHSVANMYFVPTGILASQRYEYYSAYAAAYNVVDLTALSWNAFFIKSLLPSTLGNIIGGSGLVGAIYWFIYLSDTEKKAPAKRHGKKK